MLAQGYEELKNDGILGNISRWLNKEGGEMSLCSLIKTGGHVVSPPPPPHRSSYTLHSHFLFPLREDVYIILGIRCNEN